MQQDIQEQARLRRTDAIDGSGVGPLNTALAWTAVVVLLAVIAFILGATVLT